MNANYIGVYLNVSGGLGLAVLESLVREGGFQLLNKQSGRTTRIDDEGESLETTSSVLAARMCRSEDTRFQLWESSWTGKHPGDLYCRVLFKSEAAVVEFGDLPRNSDSLVRGLWRRCCEMLDDGGILGVVVDLSGVTEDFADWDAFFIGQKNYQGPCPDILCVGRGASERVPSECDKHRQEVRGPYIIRFGIASKKWTVC